MKLVGGIHPFPLQLLQFGLYLMVVFLFFKTRRGLALPVFVAFALVPISGSFLFKLYADLWIVAGLMGTLFFLQRNKILPAALLVFLTVFLKAEAWFQTLMFLASFYILQWQNKTLSKSTYSRHIWLLVVFAVATTICIFHFQKPFKSHDFYVSLSDRFSNPVESLKIFGRIMGYYADVFFRPLLWGLLWPLSLWTLWKHRQNIRWAIVPLLCIIAAIPVAYLEFPFGHKEVVLTGSNRALWQSLPLLWLLLTATQKCHDEKAEEQRV
jgi:hypothetical protein